MKITDLNKLRELAQKATLGEYTYNPENRVLKQDGRDNAKILTITKWNGKQEHDDGRYFAALDPDTVLDLIRLAEASLDRIAKK